MCFSCTTPKELISLDGLPKLKNKINNIIDHSDININMSIKFVTLNDFKTLYSYNSKKLLIPAVKINPPKNTNIDLPNFL